mmetsp:Transcript_6387/g.18282  ORF Transcript_6387/g.18282 Transcript_6387/m.18282 type:complete len:221 (-) Transcript_6387:50-712(-)
MDMARGRQAADPQPAPVRRGAVADDDKGVRREVAVDNSNLLHLLQPMQEVSQKLHLRVETYRPEVENNLSECIAMCGLRRLLLQRVRMRRGLLDVDAGPSDLLQNVGRQCPSCLLDTQLLLGDPRGPVRGPCCGLDVSALRKPSILHRLLRVGDGRAVPCREANADEHGGRPPEARNERAAGGPDLREGIAACRPGRREGIRVVGGLRPVQLGHLRHPKA